ncbi:MAG TPA: YbaB/EbfC family nucleoid-associated protein [Candidatus Kapabacteria bacterium]|nr:YbaB/EbfC family nucleoid-associated protein [Candidatus Kapabacteria bacterium]
MNPDLMNALGAMQKMQEEVGKAQGELVNITSTAEAGGGMVKVTANGLQQIVSIKLEKEVIDPAEQEMLEDLIVAAANRALAKVKELADERMNSVAQQYMPNIPGLTM